MKRLAVSAEFNLSDDEGRRLHDGIRSGALSEIHAKQLLAPFQPEPETYFELWGLQRTGDVADPKLALRVATYLIPVYLAVSGRKPLLWVCGREDAASYGRVFGRSYDFTILRGSLRPDNPYPPLVMHHDTGGSEDEHIVMLGDWSPTNHDGQEEIDVGPLSEEQIRTLSEGCILQLRQFSEDLKMYGLGSMDGTLDYVEKLMGRSAGPK